MDGFAFLRWLMVNLPTPVIAVSSQVQRPQRVQGARARRARLHRQARRTRLAAARGDPARPRRQGPADRRAADGEPPPPRRRKSRRSADAAAPVPSVVSEADRARGHRLLDRRTARAAASLPVAAAAAGAVRRRAAHAADVHAPLRGAREQAHRVRRAARRRDGELLEPGTRLHRAGRDADAKCAAIAEGLQVRVFPAGDERPLRAVGRPPLPHAPAKPAASGWSP